MEDKETLTNQTQDIESENQNVTPNVEEQNIETAGVEENLTETEVNLEAKNSEKTEKTKKQQPKTKQKKTQKEKKEKKTKIVEVEDLSNLSDDELYAKIQTEKLLKKKKQKKIATLVGMCVSFALVVCIIVLAAVPVSLKPRCVSDGFVSAKLYPGTSVTSGVYSEENENYDKFVKYFNKSFSQSYISAIFDGSLFSYDIEEKNDSVPSESDLTANNTYIVRLTYATNHVVTYQNGTTYKSNYRNSNWNGILTFNTVYFVVNQTSGFQETTVYIIANYPIFESGKPTEKTEQKLVKITVKADTYQIYKAFDEGKI